MRAVKGREMCTMLNFCRHFPIDFCTYLQKCFASWEQHFILHTEQWSCFHVKAVFSLEHIRSSIIIRYWNMFCNSHWRRKYPTKWSNRISIVNFLLLHLKFLHFLVVLPRVPCSVTCWIINYQELHIDRSETAVKRELTEVGVFSLHWPDSRRFRHWCFSFHLSWTIWGHMELLSSLLSSLKTVDAKTLDQEYNVSLCFHSSVFKRCLVQGSDFLHGQDPPYRPDFNRHVFVCIYILNMKTKSLQSLHEYFRLLNRRERVFRNPQSGLWLEWSAVCSKFLFIFNDLSWFS